MFVVALISGMVAVRRAHGARPGARGARARSCRCWSRSRWRRRRRSCSWSRSACSSPKPRFLVPVGGMVVGNSMTAAAVALNRLGDEVRSSAARIEATLALGRHRDAGDAARSLRRSLRSAMIPLIDSTKTTGIVFFPGTMVGTLLAGAVADRRRAPAADPALDAARQRRARGADRDGARLPQLLHAAPTSCGTCRRSAEAGRSPATCPGRPAGGFTVIVPRIPEKSVQT